MNKNLIILGCSATKSARAGDLAAIHRYDGPAYKVLRSFLREHRWPSSLSVAVLSAKFGMIGGLTPIEDYDLRMTTDRAESLSASVTANVLSLLPTHKRVDLVMGRDYLQSINFDAFGRKRRRIHFAEGGIGYKLGRLHDLLHLLPAEKRLEPRVQRTNRLLYFLPDWDDFVDRDFDFKRDRFSTARRTERNEVHLSALMKPQRLCDGILVSLAQNLGSKGLLKRFTKVSDSIAPRSVREHFGLSQDQIAFGDCGAFSYINESKPTISVDQAVTLYELYDFDFGASVDHIPAERLIVDGKMVQASMAERRRRLRLTESNAADFITIHRSRGAKFIPIGVIQGITAKDYTEGVLNYCAMGYEHLALGGLVPKSDADVKEIVETVAITLKRAELTPWIHLLGIYRPALQEFFRTLGISSFDSATYFRKAWLRSDQNYLANDGSWYAAIRVPPTSDPRTMSRLLESGLPESEIKLLESQALRSLRQYSRRAIGLERCLENVLAYDRLLERAEDYERSAQQYRRTLESRPWDRCGCTVCSTIGIDGLIFRGLNRNKRRGAHNTLQLFTSIAHGPQC
jgi:hypothetical protein